MEVEPHLLAGANKRKRGNEVDYFKKYDSERKRTSRLQKKLETLKSGDTLTKLDEEVKAAKRTILKLKRANKLLVRSKERLEAKLKRTPSFSTKSFSNVSTREQRRKKALIKNIVCGEGGDRKQDVTELGSFCIDVMKNLPKDAIVPALKRIVEEDKLSRIFQTQIIEKKRTQVSKDQFARTREFVDRRKAHIGRKRKRMLKKQSTKNILKISNTVSFEPVTFAARAENDAKSRKHLRENFPVAMPYALQHDSVKVEHAFVEVEHMMKCAITLIYTTQSLHNSFFWFWDVSSQSFKVNHFEISTFFDGFPLFGGSESATIFCLRILNIAALIHRPEFNFIIFAVKAKETSAETIKLLRYCASKLYCLLNTGLTIQICGFDPTRTIPHSTILLNGTHRITFGRRNMFSGDAKATFFSQGCLSAIQTWNPFFEIETESYVCPDIVVSDQTYVPHRVRVQRFLAINDFRNGQREKFVAEVKLLKQQRLSEEELPKKIANAWKRVVVKAVNQKAKELKTSCVHHSPFAIAELCGVCGLHMDTNEYLRVLNHIVEVGATFTMAHNLARVFDKPIGKDGRDAVTVPDIDHCHETAPLLKIVLILENSKLKRISNYYRKYYTPPPAQQKDLQSYMEGDDIMRDLDEIFNDDVSKSSSVEEQRASRIRLIGQNVHQLAPILPNLVQCLCPPTVGNESVWPDGVPQTTQEMAAVIVCWTYIHLLRSLSSLYAAWVMTVNLDEIGASLLGELFVRLVHRFALHKSANTFLFAQVAPFLMDSMKDTYRLSNTKALSLGSYCRNEGGELTNQSSKGEIKFWTARRRHFLNALLDQRLEIHLGGMYMFEDTCPTPVNILDAAHERSTWSQRFGPQRPGMCGTCRFHPALSSLREVLDDSKEGGLFSANEVFSFLKDTKFKGHDLAHLFCVFLNMNENERICSVCSMMFQLCVGVFTGRQNELSFI